MTSEAIEESGVNVFMFALALGSGAPVRWRLVSSPAGANELSDIGLLKPGRRTATVRFQDDPFTIPLRCHQRNAAVRRRFAFLPECVQEASPPNRPDPSTLS